MFGSNKIIFLNVKFSKNYLFEMSKFKKVTREEKNTKIGGNPGCLL
jgi:hypothetical protein